MNVTVRQEARGEWSVYAGLGYLNGPFVRREDAQKWADDWTRMADCHDAIRERKEGVS